MLLSNTDITYQYLEDRLSSTISADEIEIGEVGLKHLFDENSLLKDSGALTHNGWDKTMFLLPDEFAGLHKQLSNHIGQMIEEQQPIMPGFELEKYHKFVTQDETHYAISSWAMLPEIIEPYYSLIKHKVEETLGIPLRTKKINHKGTKGHFIGFRIVRPGKSDHNPFHRDAWLDYWRDTINVWIPICGFENGNTLCLLPSTHILDDSEIIKTKQGAIINGKTYHVPAAVAITKPFDSITPHLNAGEGLIFSPYLIHGKGINHLPDSTRISIELRFCRK